MSHEVIISGYICGPGIADGRPPGDLAARNAAVLAALPEQDEWPWLVRGMFALPAPWPQGTFRSQIIHFGASLKDDPSDPICWDQWLQKFENVLTRLFWYHASVIVQSEFGPSRLFEWLIEVDQTTRMAGLLPEPPVKWQRTVRSIGGAAAETDV